MSLALFSASHMHSAWFCLCISTVQGWPSDFPDDPLAFSMMVCRAIAPPVLVAVFLLRFTLAQMNMYDHDHDLVSCH